MDSFKAYLVYNAPGRYGAALQRPGDGVTFDEVTLELPAGWAVVTSPDGVPVLYDHMGNSAGLFATDQKVIGAASANTTRYFRRIPSPGDTRKTLRDFRKEAGMTQLQLSTVSGVNARQIQRVENGDADIENVTARTLVSLADALGIDPHQLLGF